MSMYLTTISENYRASSEKEAATWIEKAKADKSFTLLKSSTVYKHHKETKTKPEEEYWIVSLTKQFNEVRDPEVYVKVTYELDNGCFPQVVDSDFEEDEYDSED